MGYFLFLQREQKIYLKVSLFYFKIAVNFIFEHQKQSEEKVWKKIIKFALTRNVYSILNAH